MFRKVLIILLSLITLLFTSCSEDYSSIALLSEHGGEISIVQDKTSMLLLLDDEIIARLCSISSLSVEEMVRELEEDVVLYPISSESYENRERYIDLLMSQNENKKRAVVLAENSKVIENSNLIEEMDLLSSSYDSTMLEQVKNVKDIYEYELSSVLYNGSSWDEAKSFYKEWKSIVIR